MSSEDQKSDTQNVAKRRPWRFSLKTLLVCLTLFCLWFGTWANSANRQRRAVQAIELSGGEFNYDYQEIPNPRGQGTAYSHQVEPPGPRWLRTILGEHYFITPVWLSLSNKSGIQNDCLATLGALPHLEGAMFSKVPFRDSDVAHLACLANLRALAFHEGTLSGPDGPRNFDFLQPLTQLESLSLINSRFGDADAKNLARMSHLTNLFLYKTAIGDEGLSHLRNLKRIEMLGVSGTPITDRGIAHLSDLPNLTYLAAGNTAISDAAIDSLAKMSSLRDLELHQTRVTKKGIEKLRKALPRCKINGKGGDGKTSLDDPFN